MFENLKLTQRLKGLGKLCLASLLWLLVRPASAVASAVILIIGFPIILLEMPFEYWLDKLKAQTGDSVAYKIKYYIADKIVNSITKPLVKLLEKTELYYIAFPNQKIGGIIGDYYCFLYDEDDTKKIRNKYVHESNWFKDGWSELFTSPPATPEKPPATPEKDDPSIGEDSLSATNPSLNGMRSVTSDPAVEPKQGCIII